MRSAHDNEILVNDLIEIGFYDGYKLMILTVNMRDMINIFLQLRVELLWRTVRVLLQNDWFFAK